MRRVTKAAVRSINMHERCEAERNNGTICNRPKGHSGYCQVIVKGASPGKLRHVAAMKAMVNEIKIASGCIDCGYRDHPAALDFDHLPGCVKVSGISIMVTDGRSRETILAEIDKCEVRCANCH